MKIEAFNFNNEKDLFSNMYLLIDENKSCLVVDPSKITTSFFDYLNKNQLKLEGILLTHGHFDHTRGVNEVLERYDVPLYIGFYEEELLTNPKLNCSAFKKDPTIISKKPILVSDKDEITLLDEPIIVLHTPYHTSGAVCYYLKDSNVLLSGDSLFYASIGRSDLPTSDKGLIESSLKKILSLPENTKVYPGHGPSTTIEREKNTNRVFIK